MTERHKITPASSLIFRKGDEIILLKRCNTGFRDGDYDLVTGHVEEKEPFTIAAVREGKEESGVEINPKDLEFAHAMKRLQDGTQERINIFFVVKKWIGELKNMEPEKCDDLNWFNINNLPDNIVPYVKKALEHINEGKHYSEYGHENL
jgi:ADP-ribose pyrophosphatase YjhB (NUDIX family)